MTCVLSCGVLVLNESGDLLLCHTTGTSRWDIPKGCAEPGETPLHAAVREVFEETGLRLSPDALEDLGEFNYLPAKRLHLYSMRVRREDIELESLVCTTHCMHFRFGKLVPEVDDFDWKPLGEVHQWCGKNLARVLSSLAVKLQALMR